MPGTNDILESSPETEGPAAPARPPLTQSAVPAFFRWLTYLLLIPLIALATAFFGTLALIAGLWDTSGWQQHAIARMWARVLLRVALSPVEIVHPERLAGIGRRHGREPAVCAANHLSYYDTPVLFAKLPFQFRILARAPLWKVPFIGWYLNRSGQMPIDQSSPRAGALSLSRGVKALQAGMPLMVFPEGGRSPSGEPRDMIAGAAWMALKAQVPLVPLTLVGTYELLPMHVYVLNPRPLKLIVGEPISTAGLTTRDAERLTQQLRAVITETYMAAQT